MKVSALGTGLFALAMSAFAGDVNVHLLVTKQLSKKTVSTAVYNLRGATPAAAHSGSEPVNEYDRVVVWLEGGAAKPRPPVTVSIDQKNTSFDPDLMVIPIGSIIEFPNSDPIFHNVFSLSHAQPFDLGYYRQGQSKVVKFSRAGVVQVYCHLHSQMYAVIIVTSSPWFGKPTAQGEYSFNDIPPGHYRVASWHKVAGLHETQVDIPEHGSAEATIRIPVDTEQRP
jgi:plastocyanin